jgi:2-phospho-L-lactate/phosphoenolpyruvate guanylyltransferase
MRTAAILPVKRFVAAKSRLGASIADPLRLQLARAMVDDVLLALSQTPSIELTIVITRERALLETGREHGVLLVADAAEDGQSAAVTLGVRRALAEGIEQVLCIPGDCPALDPAELESLLASSAARATGEAEVVIVPDRHGTGTNGLLLTPPDAIAPSFGPDSCERHRALALAVGVECRVERPASLLLDIDTGADLAALRDRLAAANARALRTRAVLGQSERTNILSITSSG